MDIEVENFNTILGKYEPNFEKVFVNDEGKEFVLYGLVWGKNDLYYGMHPIGGGKSWLLSCVVDLESHGFKLKDINNE